MFNIDITETGFVIKMSATLENIDVADDRLAEYLASSKMPIDNFAIRIMLREGLLNAVSHGSGLDASKMVSFSLRVEPEGVRVEIRDSGRGFDRRLHEVSVDSLEEGGRGLALLKIYSDNMDFNEAGNEVTLYKRYQAGVSTGR
jgi:anti-sigma regulatory factor (Ser/Thr protein kinase)